MDSLEQEVWFKEQYTFCVECRFYINEGGPRPLWYDQYCGAITHPQGRDPVSGRWGFNTTSGAFIEEQPHPYCKDINTSGNCKLFEAK